MEPPKVTFRTTDGGRVRFNPNIYSSGKVCLSVLGTWHGPAWTSAESISSVLLSIQSLMCAKPYHNEPGYENRGDKETVQAYSDYIRYEMLRVAVVDQLKHPSYPEEFLDIIRRHFLMWYDMHMKHLQDLKKKLDGKPYQDAFSSAKGTYKFGKLVKQLKALKEEIDAHYENMSKPLKAENSASRSNALAPHTYATERLHDEYRVIQRQSPPGISASPRNMEDPFIWDVAIVGANNTPLEGGFFSLEIVFSTEHPYVCPYVRFTSKMFHPNITSDGVPALDVVSTRWRPETRIIVILTAIQKLLKEPSLVYPVNEEAALLFMTDRPAYNKRVRRMTQDL